MFIPASSDQALALLFLNLFCWGTWGNTIKWSRLSFTAYYVLFSVGLLVFAGGLGLLLGADWYKSDDQKYLWQRDFFANLKQADGEHILYACLSGMVFSFANVLLVLLINMVGLAVAFPICIGLSLVGGTLVSYAVEPGQTQLSLLLLGVGLAVCALLAMTAAHYYKDQHVKHAEPLLPPTEANAQAQQPKSLGFTISLCVLCGLLMGSFAPLETLAQEKGDNGLVPHALMPYTTFLFFCAAAAVVALPTCYGLARHPVDGGPVVPSIMQAIREGSWDDNLQPFLGAFIWSLGTLLNFVVGSKVSQAVAYSIAQAAPMAATGWGIFLFKEFDGAPARCWAFLAFMALAYSGAIVSIALSSGKF